MPANPVYQDGLAEYGTALLTFGTGASQWTAVCDGSFSVTYPTRRVEKRDQYGVPNGAFGIKETPNGRCTIYLPAGKRAVPGDTFTADVISGVTFIVTECEDPYEADDYRKQNLTFYQKLNP